MLQRKAQFRRIEPKYGDLMRDLFAGIGEEIASKYFFEEYEIDWNLPELPEEEKESFRQHPEAFLRKMLADNGFDPINGVAVYGDPEDCIKTREITTTENGVAATHATHIKSGPQRSTWVVF